MCEVCLNEVCFSLPFYFDEERQGETDKMADSDLFLIVNND